MNRLLCSLIFLFLSLASFGQNFKLQSGDLLFVGAGESSLSEAIDAVTQTDKQQHYVHVGIVDKVQDSIWVIHADSEEGVVRESIADFSVDRPIIDAYRVKDISSEQVTQSIASARKTIGQPYNFTYVMLDTGYYCSELVYEAFSHAEIFELNPMSFQDPETKTFHQGWIDHYEALDMSIPEGEPGCNPNGMAADDDLDFLGRLSN